MISIQMATKRPRRLQIDISADLERQLILWSNDRDTPLNTWARIVLRLQVDENKSRVRENNQAKADRLGIPLADYENQILRKYGFDFDREREELENGFNNADEE